MPDLDIVTAWTCNSNMGNWFMEIGSGKGDGTKYTVRFQRMPPGHPVQIDWTCTCKGYQFRKTCSHIEHAKRMRCGWNEELEPTAKALPSDANVHRETGHKCPKCRTIAYAVRVGV